MSSTRVDVKRVPQRRRLVHDGRELAWRVESIDDRGVRRTLFDVATGEVLDDVWLDDEGRVRSWSASSNKTKGRTDPPAAVDRAADTSAAVDRTTEASLSSSRGSDGRPAGSRRARRRRPLVPTTA